MMNKKKLDLIIKKKKKYLPLLPHIQLVTLHFSYVMKKTVTKYQPFFMICWLRMVGLSREKNLGGHWKSGK